MSEVVLYKCWELILASVSEFERKTKMVESKMAKFKLAEFKMAAIINLNENESVWIRLVSLSHIHNEVRVFLGESERR